VSALPALFLAALVLGGPGPTADTLLVDSAGVVAGGLEPLHHTRTDWNPEAITYLFKTQEGASVAVRLRHPDSGLGEPVAGRYRAEIVIEPATARAGLAKATDALMRRLTTRARLGPELRAPRPPPPAGVRLQDGTETGASHRGVAGAGMSAGLEFWLCVLLLVLALIALPALIAATRQALAGSSERVAGALFALAGVVAIQLAFVPSTLVGVFAGYASVADAVALAPVAKYGAFTTALYGPALRALGPSTDVVIGLNLVLGLALIPLAGAWAARLSGTARAGWIAILVVGLTPALMRDRASESVLVPVQFALLAGGVHLDRWLEKGGRLHGLGAVAWGALALHGRPEAWLIAPLLALAWVQCDARVARLRGPGFRLGAGLFLVAVLPRAWSLWHYIGSAARHGDVPGLSAGGDLAGIWERLQSLNILLSPHLHAVSVTLLALVALFVVRPTRLRAALLVGASGLVWILLSTLDLPAVSVPRVQAPALLLAAILAAVALASLAQGPERWRRACAYLGLALALVPRPEVLSTLFVPTNAQGFDQWWRRATAALPAPEKDLCVVALSMSDPPPDVVLRHLPLYELPRFGPQGESLSISTFLETPASVLASECQPIYIEGPQCYARSFDPAGERPEQAKRLPICQRMHREWALMPLHVEDIPNAGNPDFPFYGASETLRYGLYGIVHLDPTNTGPRKVSR
jgi:hypothetical protein